jgi:hypothetical protein
MKESLTSDNVAEPTDEQPSSDSKSEKPAGTSPTKKGPVVRKPIRPRVARPAASVVKSDAFEVEFAFDPNEDPFKPKKKLGASPTRDGSPRTQTADTMTSPNHVVSNLYCASINCQLFNVIFTFFRITLKPTTL